jgi:pyrroline-5-carboxylate reductase
LAERSTHQATHQAPAPIGKRVGFVGAGNMAEALIKGLLAARTVSAPDVWASHPRPERAEELSRRFSIQVTSDNLEVVRRCDVVILAVKPQVMARVLQQIAPAAHDGQLFVSIAAGIPLSALEGQLPGGARVVRTMPNTPALVDAGATAIAAGGHATDVDLEDVRRIFSAVGLTVTLDESQLDAVTGLSGSGPAYVFLIIEALSDAGVKVGLSRHIAQTLATQTVLGSAKLLLETGEHPGRLKDMVTSPGGTAIAGLHTLEAGGLRTTLINAVEAATRRSQELGQAMLAKVAASTESPGRVGK